MTAIHRLRRLWAAVRPRTRRGAILGSIGVLAGAAALSVALFVGAAMAWSPYLTFSLDPDSNARAWAALKPTYAGSSACAACHEPVVQVASTGRHAGIGCESCHGPLEEHALLAGEDEDATVILEVPGDHLCVRCHVPAAGRPATVRQIVPEDHYVSTCLQCHDPHTGVANRPPVVEHTLLHLPPCLTCHGPEGFKARNQRHPVGSSDDKPCLECHAPGRGPAVGEGFR